MQYSRREEPFRYTFAEPLLGEFQVIRANGMDVESRYGLLKIMDLSFHGAKIRTGLNFRTKRNKVELMLHFRIVSQVFTIPGHIVYQIPDGAEFIYGLHLNTDHATRELLTQELKAYARLIG